MEEKELRERLDQLRSTAVGLAAVLIKVGVAVQEQSRTLVELNKHIGTLFSQITELDQRVPAQRKVGERAMVEVFTADCVKDETVYVWHGRFFVEAVVLNPETGLIRIGEDRFYADVVRKESTHGAGGNR